MRAPVQSPINPPYAHALGTSVALDDLPDGGAAADEGSKAGDDAAGEMTAVLGEAKATVAMATEEAGL